MKLDPCASPEAISLENALERITNQLKPRTSHLFVPLKEALNNVTASDIRSSIDVPDFRNSSMDGYAIAKGSNQHQTLTVKGTSWAGRPFTETLNPQECIRIFTGAYVPDDCDCVVMQENVTTNGESITIQHAALPNENVRDVGSNVQQGQIIFPKGHRLGPADIGVLASCGLFEIEVYQPLKVGFFSTGDELVGAGHNLNLGQIYDSNRYSLGALLKNMNVEAIDLGILEDDPAVIEQALTDAATTCDVLITSGGVSVGEADFITKTLEKIGRVDLWKIAVKPGKPFTFGHIKDTVFFGLPGNPVSVMVSMDQIVKPALMKMAGLPASTTNFRIKAIAKNTLNKAVGRMEFQRGIAVINEDGQLEVTSVGHQDSHILTSMSKANCYIVLEADITTVNTGEYVKVELFSTL